MPDHLPSHPDTGSGAGRHSTSEPTVEGRSRSRVLLIVGAVVLVALILVLHLTGVVGAGSH